MSPEDSYILSLHERYLSYLEELLFLVGSDGDIGSRVGNAGKNEAVGNLVILKEGLVGLVNGSSNDLTGAGGASTSTARVRKVKTLLLSLVEHVGVIRALDDGLTLRSLKGNLVGGSSGHRGVDGVNADVLERVAAHDTEALVSTGRNGTAHDRSTLNHVPHGSARHASGKLSISGSEGKNANDAGEENNVEGNAGNKLGVALLRLAKRDVLGVHGWGVCGWGLCVCVCVCTYGCV
mmetsp:Transcript_20671/g.41721  ORF Transcript_20671/g.41721 Transcript_20671/m.41721 type:complete len:236 (-) Transcript_20671:1-708(-)